MGQRYNRMQDQKPGSGLLRNQDFCKEVKLEPKVKQIFKMSKLGEVVSKMRPIFQR